MKPAAATLIAIAIALLSFGLLRAQEESEVPDESPKRLSPEGRIGKLEEVVSQLSRQVSMLQREVATRDRNERPSAGGSTKTNIFALQHARAKELAEMLEDLFQSRGREGETVRIASDDRNNAIVVTARQEQLEAIEAVLQAADRPTESQETKIFSLQNSDAMEIARIVESLYPPRAPTEVLRIAIDQRTNSVIVMTRSEQLKEIEALLQRLDEAEDKPSAKEGPEPTEGPEPADEAVKIMQLPTAAEPTEEWEWIPRPYPIIHELGFGG